MTRKKKLECFDITGLSVGRSVIRGQRRARAREMAGQ